jgi:hypothetical protein
VLWNCTKVKLFFTNQQVFEKFVDDFFLTAAHECFTGCYGDINGGGCGECWQRQRALQHPIGV